MVNHLPLVAMNERSLAMVSHPSLAVVKARSPTIVSHFPVVVVTERSPAMLSHLPPCSGAREISSHLPPFKLERKDLQPWSVISRSAVVNERFLDMVSHLFLVMMNERPPAMLSHLLPCSSERAIHSQGQSSPSRSG